MRCEVLVGLKSSSRLKVYMSARKLAAVLPYSLHWLDILKNLTSETEY